MTKQFYIKFPCLICEMPVEDTLGLFGTVKNIGINNLKCPNCGQRFNINTQIKLKPMAKYKS